MTYSADADPNMHANLAREADERSNRPPVLVQYWRVIVRWRWAIIGIIAASLVIGLLATVLATPKYTATSTIEISRQQDRVVNVQDVRQESNPADQEFYQTQYALLRSRSLAERVVADLRLSEDDAFLNMFGINTGQSVFGAESSRRTSAAQRAIRQREATDALLEHVGIDPIRGSSLVVVTFVSPDPALSQRVVNKWTENFMSLTLARRFDATSYAREFLEGRLNQLRVRLEESERRLVRYASAERIINLPAGAGGSAMGDRPIVAEDLAAINSALARATSERVTAQSQLGSGSGGRSAAALQNVAIAGLRQRRAEAAAEYARLQVQFEPEYPPLAALREQVEELDRAITREETRVGASFRTAYNEAVEKENSLRDRVEELKGNLLDLRRRSIQYNIYQRDVDTNRQLYDALLQRYKEIGVAGGIGTNNIAIVDPAKIPEKPSSPSLPLNLLLALFVGIVIATLVTLALEQIDEAVKDPNDVPEATGLSLLGTIPRVDVASPTELLLDRKSSVSEAYLSLQTNLQFSTDHGFPQSLAVTSTRAAEGKSTSSFAIAQSLARTGRRVILVDGDMRSPSVHELFELQNERGISNFLSGDNDLQAMLVTPENSSLTLLLAGPQPPNAAELLTGQRLEILIDELSKTFDHVIIDSPPVLGLADAPLIASRVEGVVYAVQARGARTSTIRAAIARLHSANANLFGIVLTKFDARKAHHGYGYDYGYDYGAKPAAS